VTGVKALRAVLFGHHFMCFRLFDPAVFTAASGIDPAFFAEHGPYGPGLAVGKGFAAENF
jgi:hypothetical protein